MESIWPLRAAGRGIHVWEVATGAQVWVSPTQFTRSVHVVWSPDGRRAGQLWR